MKKAIPAITLILLCILSLSAFVACNKNGSTNTSADKSKSATEISDSVSISPVETSSGESSDMHSDSSNTVSSSSANQSNSQSAITDNSQSSDETSKGSESQSASDDNSQSSDDTSKGSEDSKGDNSDSSGDTSKGDSSQSAETDSTSQSSEQTSSIEPEHEHSYQFVEFVWQADFTAQAKLVCPEDNDEVYYSASVTSQETPATCENDGLRTYTATYDRFSDIQTEIIDALGHDYGEWQTVKAATTEEEGLEQRVCSHNENHIETRIIPQKSHDLVFHEGKAATCTEAGYKDYYTCNDCDYTTYEAIPALGHQYQAKITAPTCTEKGYTTYTCSVCGDSYVDDYVNAFGHDYGEWKVSKAATCTEKGEEKHVCSHDESHFETREISALGHQYQAKVTVPTCTEKGYTTYTCSVCGNTYIENYVNALGHDYQTQIIAPTCTEKGYTAHTCSRCNDSYVDTYVNALCHDFGEWIETKAPTCTEEGILTRYCSHNNSHIEEMTIVATGHFFSEDWTTDSNYHWHKSTCGHNVVSNRNAHEYEETVVASTCEKDGYILHTCKICGFSFKDNITSATGHSYDDEWSSDEVYHWHSATCGHNVVNDKAEHNFVYVSIVAATCDSEGYDYKTCSDCGYEYRYNIVPALGHNKSDVEIKNLVKATSTSSGYYTKVFYCERCEQTIISNYIMFNEDGETEESAEGEWNDSVIFSNVPYPANGVCIGLVTNRENIPIDKYQGAATALFDRITIAQVKSYTSTLQSNGFSKNVTENTVYGAYTFSAYHKTLNLYIGVGYSDSEMGISAYKTGTVTKANTGNGATTSTVIPSIKETEGLVYELSEDGSSYSVTGYQGSDNYVVIPYKYNDKPIKSIGGFAVKKIKVVIILAEIEEITRTAFYNCDKLIYLSIPSSVKIVGEKAFYGCSNKIYNEYDNAYYLGNEDNPYAILLKAKNTSISSCVINKETKLINYSAFDNCSKLTNIIVEEKNNSYYSVDGILYNKQKTQILFVPILINGSITIPNSVASIDDGTFYNCSGLTGVTIPDSVTRIGSSAFSGCSGLTNITIPDSITSIESGTFYGCSGLTSVIIPDIVTSIGSGAFEDCRSLTSITIPDGVTSIGGSVFYGCSGLTNIIIPDSVTKLESDAFRKCSSLTNVTIGNNVTKISTSTFSECSSLTNIVIGNNVTKIGDVAFYGCSKLTSIIIPDSVNVIGQYAFKYCTKLTDITIGYGVTDIGESAFEYCISLTSITIPNNVIHIGVSTFANCSSLKSIFISDNITDIGSNAFKDCNKLQYNEFDNAYYLGNDNNPYVVLIRTKSSTITSCTINDNTRIIYESAFSLCNELTMINISNNVVSIGDSAFYGCDKIKSLTIPIKVINIGKRAFYGCTALTNISIPDSITSMGSGAFDNCEKLQYNDFDNAYYLGNEDNPCVMLVKAKSTLITSCIINEKTKFIYYKAFNDCSNLTSLNLPNNILSLGSYAFDGCSKLITITIPEKVASIGKGAFYNCSALKTVVFEKTKKWQVSSSNPLIGKVIIKDSNLLNVDNAAKYLTSKYIDYDWVLIEEED